MSKLGFLVAVSVVSLGAAVGAWYYKYQGSSSKTPVPKPN